MAYTDIDKPTDYFNTVLYTGNGSSQTLTMDNVGLLWMKRRDSSIRHCLFDSVRGGHYTGSGDPPLLVSDSSAASQGTDIDSAAKGITFGTTQTVIGNDASGYSYNTSGHSMVGWQWSAGGSASSNTDGSITSTVSANTTAGFSIVSYTGTGSSPATIGHGLGATPNMVIIKDRDSSKAWVCYHSALGSTKGIFLEQTAGANTSSTYFNNTAPTSSVFTIANSSHVNTSSDKYIAYCFSEKKGFSRFGSYVGNGSNDGSYIHLGFKPAFVLQKSTAVQGWQLQDNKRLGYNGANKLLQPHDSASESDVNRIDILSNGFKVRTTDAGQNTSGQTYIYMAFAESPFTTSTGIPTVAR
jgi:hypothetical protein